MADISKTVEIIFGGKNDVSKTINAIERDVDKMAVPFANAAENILKLDAALAALAVGGLVAAYKKAVEFESSVVNLRKVVGDSPEEMKLAQDEAMKLSGVYGESASKILESTANFVQAGFNVKESILLTKNAMDLKIAGDIGATESSERLVSILKGFKAPAEDAARVVDILNEVSNKYATNVGQLSVGMADLSPIAKIMGFSFEETAGLLTPVIEVFGSGEESARALKTGLLKLIDDTGPVGAALESLGVSQKTANGELRSGKDILLDVQQAFKGLSDPQKLFITQQLVGIDQSAKMVEVFNGLDKSIEVTGVALRAYGSAQTEVDARLGSSQAIIDRLKVGFENLGIAIGGEFKDAVKGMLQGGIDIETALTKLANSTTFDPLLKNVSKFADSVGATMADIARNLPEAFANVDFNGFLRTLDSLKTQLTDAFDIGDASPEELANKIQFVVDSITSLLNITNGIGEIFNPLFVSIKSGVDAFNSLDSSTKELIGNILGLGTAYAIFGPLGLALVALGTDAETMNRVTGTAFAAFENGLNAIKVAVLSLAMVFATASKGMAELLDYVPGYDASADIERTTDRVNVLRKLLDDANSDLVSSSDKVANAFSGNTQKAEQAKSKTAEYAETIAALPKTADTDVNLHTKDAVISAKDLKTAITDLPSEKTIGIEVMADGTTIETTRDMIIKTFPDGTVYMTNIGTRADESMLAETGRKIKDAIPDKKTMEIEAKLDAARIKEQSAIVQKSIEWNAKLNIAQAESNAKVLIETFKTIDAAITSTGVTISSLVGDLADLSGGQKYMVEGLIKAEEERRQQTFDQQKKLTDAEIDMMKARAAAMQRGDAMIQIDGAGLQPHLEAFMFEILAAIQIRANAEGAAFLTGI